MTLPTSRFARLLALFAVCVALSACGGGGGGSSSGSNSTTASNPNGASSTPAGAPLTASAPVAASSPTSVPQSTTPNVQPIVVTSAQGLTRNMLTTSVTVCEPGATPGSNNCATIDNIQVDTGSQGLRILASALPSTLSLPTLPSGSGVSAECAVFGGGYTWGAVHTADVRMAGQVASALPFQVIADATTPTVPADCAGSGKAMQTLITLRANGIVGVGVFAADCGSGCVNSALPRWYYSCTSGGACTASTQPLAQQVTNPVSQFALDNNGVVIDLPAIADTGAVTVSGSLIFGIGTQSNNVLGNATVLTANSSTGFVTTSSNGQTYQSYVDSGSNGFFFHDTQLPQCGYWYCPTSTQAAVAEIIGNNGATSTISFAIGNSNTLFASSNNAFNDLAGLSSNAFGWGLPFFYGRRVYTAIASRETSAGPGPYFAF